MAEERSTTGIARHVRVAEGTVEKHVRDILIKPTFSQIRAWISPAGRTLFEACAWLARVAPGSLQPGSTAAVAVPSSDRAAAAAVHVVAEKVRGAGEHVQARRRGEVAQGCTGPSRVCRDLSERPYVALDVPTSRSPSTPVSSRA
jgi:hypothetical protein